MAISITGNIIIINKKKKVPVLFTYRTQNTHRGLSLPYAHVDSTLRGLACKAEGFDGSSIGERDGHGYQVVNLSGYFNFSFLSCLCVWVHKVIFVSLVIYGLKNCLLS